MAITLYGIIGLPAEHAIELAVSVSGLVVSVASGDFKHLGVDYTIATQQDYTVLNQGSVATVEGWLAKDSGGDEVVLVDDFVNAADKYEFDDGAYERLHLLYTMNVPANTTDLAGVPIDVYHIVVPA